MLIVYGFHEKLGEIHSVSLHSYSGEVGEKQYTAAQGTMFTSLGYLTRKAQQSFSDTAQQLQEFKDKYGKEGISFAEILNPDSAADVQGRDVYDNFVDAFTLESNLVLTETKDIMKLTPLRITPKKIVDLSIRVSKEESNSPFEAVKFAMKQLVEKHGDVGEIKLILGNKSILKSFNKRIDELGIECIEEIQDAKFNCGQAQVRTIAQLARNRQAMEHFGDFNYVFEPKSPTQFPMYWKAPDVRNPLLSFRQLIYVSTGVPKYYYSFDDNDIYDYGKRSNTVAYSIVLPKERSALIDEYLTSKLCDSLEPIVHYLTLANFYKPAVISNIYKYGTDLLYQSFGKDMYNEEVPVSGKYDPPGLSMRGLGYHQALEKILEQYLAKDFKDTLDVQDVTSDIYTVTDGKYKVTKTVVDGAPLLRLPSKSDDKKKVYLVMGTDLPNKDALNRLTGKITVNMFSSRDMNIVRHGIIIESADGIGIYSNYNCNVRFVTLQSSK